MSQKNIAVPSTEENVVHLHNEEKSNKIMKFEGKWIELKNLILSEVIQTEKDKYNICSLISGF